MGTGSNRGVLLALSGIGLLFLGGLGLILALESAPSPAPAPEASPPAVAAPAPVSPPPAAPRGPPSPAAEPDPGPAAAPGAPVPVFADAGQVAAQVRRELRGGLADLAASASSCGVSSAGMLLTLETLQGAVRVAEVEVDPQAGVDPSAAACLRGLVTGRVLPAPSARPGRRWRTPFWADGAERD